MGCLSSRRLVTVLVPVVLLAVGMTGCVSLQVQKRRQGADLVAPGELVLWETSLQEVLARCGAPYDVVDMHPDFGLHYRQALLRSVNVSVGIPLKYVWLPNPSVDTRGRIQRYDTALLVFTADGVLKGMRYEKAIDRPLMPDYW